MEPDLARPRVARWPNFTPPALRAGARGVFAFPLQAGRDRIGVLTIHQDHTGLLSGEQMADSLVLAEVLTRTMVAIQAGSEADVLAGELSDANAHRAEVHQASGMLAVALGIQVGEALVLMRAHAFASERTVAAVADDVVAGRLRLDEDRDDDGNE